MDFFSETLVSSSISSAPKLSNFVFLQSRGQKWSGSKNGYTLFSTFLLHNFSMLLLCLSRSLLCSQLCGSDTRKNVRERIVNDADCFYFWRTDNISEERILKICDAYILDRSFSLFVDFCNNDQSLLHSNPVCAYLPHQSSSRLKTRISPELILQMINRTV